MAFDARIFKVLIASPGDVDEERRVIPEVIARWNNINAETNGVVLLPAKWETHSAPLLGQPGQAVINEQVLETCDMAIGVFWTRLGTPTGKNVSGTAEEIEWFIQKDRPVMVYFSSQPINPTKLDLDQYRDLMNFQTKLQKVGLTGSYTSVTDLAEKLLDQITINVRNLLVGKPAKHATPSEFKKTVKAITDIMKAGQVYIEDYKKDGEVKLIVVKGDTKSIKDELKALDGRWNRALVGWTFPKSREIEIAEFIKTHG